MSNTAKVAFVNRFGTLSDVERKIARNGKPFVRAKLTSIPKAGEPFVTPFASFNQKVIDAVLASGNGGFISLRGPIEKRERDGGKYTEDAFNPVMVNTPKEKAAAEGEAQAGAVEADAAAKQVAEEVPF